LLNKEIEPIAKKYIELRYKLLTYNYSLAWEARNTGMPMMRAMWMHYPKDETCKRIADQYMWGPNMLIAPVYEKGTKTRTVYLPEGQWYDWWNNELKQGGTSITKDIDLSVMPIYVPAGSIVPVDPVRQYTDEKVDIPTTLKVYTGSDGFYTLYDDDGISQDYLTGKACTLIDIKWDQNKKQLNLSSPAGDSLIPTEKTFIIELIPTNITKEIVYTGKPLSVRL
jgi:alpha-glucosidase/alpha-D-xyloside xylohydrolase